MAVLDFLLRRRSSPKVGKGGPLLARIAARVPQDGSAGLLPASDPAEAEEEKRLGERYASELHLHGRATNRWLGQTRRLAAIASSARRRDPNELREAIEGIEPWELPELLESLAERRDLPPGPLAKVAHAAAERATEYRTVAAALALLTPGVTSKDRPLLMTAGRSPALTGICARALEGLPSAEVDPALLELARVSGGIGRALALERLAIRHLDDPSGISGLVPQALELAAEIADPLERAYAAVPLLEVAGADRLLASHPALAPPVAACLEAVSRGGWNGGPGPGLGRLPNASLTAHALLTLPGLREEARLAAAHAVLDARPIPTGPARLAAEKILGAASAPR